MDPIYVLRRETSTNTGHIQGYVYIRDPLIRLTGDAPETLLSAQIAAPRGYQPLSDATIEISNQRKKTNHDGGFSFTDIRAGWHTLTVSHQLIRPIKREVEIKKGRVTWLDDTDAIYSGIGYYVIIGVDTYPYWDKWDEKYIIPGPRRDAERVYKELFLANRLAGQGTLLINQNATKEKIKKAIKAMAGMATSKEDYLVIYFSGKSGLDYLSPYDSGNRYWDDEITDSELASWVKGFSGHVTLIVDGADSESMADGFGFSPNALRQNNYTVISAAKKGETVNYDEKLDSSVFTYFLLEGIKTRRADFNRDRDITGYELFNYINNSMRDYYNNYRDADAHRPSIHEGYYGDTVIFRY